MIYYLFSYKEKLPGVNTKVIAKIKALNDLGLPVKGIILYENEKLDLSSFPDKYYDKYYFNSRKFYNLILVFRPLGIINSFLVKRRFVKHLYNKILKNKTIDLIITRYGISDFNTLWFVKKLNGKILYESNTNEIEQLKLVYKGVLKSPIWATYDYFCEKYFGPVVLRRVKGVICVTNEIAKFQSQRIGNKFNNLVEVVSNGIKCNTIKRKKKVVVVEVLNLIMIRGTDAPWHGYEIIRDAVLKSSSKFRLYVVGDIRKDVDDERIIFTGKLKSNEIDQLVDRKNIHIGIGSLALHLVGLNEACPLKVRQYLARGLPVLYNYYDSDLSINPEFSEKYCYYLEGDLDLNFLRKWYLNLSKTKDFENNISEWATKNLDYEIKMVQYKRIIEKIINHN